MTAEAERRAIEVAVLCFAEAVEQHYVTIMALDDDKREGMGDERNKMDTRLEDAGLHAIRALLREGRVADAAGVLPIVDRLCARLYHSNRNALHRKLEENHES